MMVGLWAISVLFKKSYNPYGTARWVGLGLCLIGLAGVIVSRYTLGRSFSIRPKATALVKSGLYSRIRNPIYVSGIIFITGVAVMTWQPYFLAIVVVMIPMQIWRARREARVLEEKFGDEYREYRRGTWF
jgi:protein-S-isoprenylcysteine O-methyltransferase Ste14